MNTRKQSQVYTRNASGGAQNLDIMSDFALENSIIIAITLIIRGTMTSGGGGAITGFHRDAPCGMIQNAKLWGNYRGGVAKNQRTIFDMPPQQMFYPGNFFASVFNALLRTSSGAAATDPFRATIPVPLIDPLADTQQATYIDCRDYTSLKLDLRWAADTDIATTNVSTVQAVELEVELELWEDGPVRGVPHYEPAIVYKELDASTAQSRLTQNGDFAWDGDLWALWLQQHDDSAAGDAERVDGLIRAFSLEHGRRPAVPFGRWDPFRRKSFSTFPYALSTTEVAGVAGIHFPNPRRSRGGSINIVRNTIEAVPPGVTAITPAAGDALFVTGVTAEPVYARQDRLRRR